MKKLNRESRERTRNEDEEAIGGNEEKGRAWRPVAPTCLHRRVEEIELLPLPLDYFCFSYPCWS